MEIPLLTANDKIYIHGFYREYQFIVTQKKIWLKLKFCAGLPITSVDCFNRASGYKRVCGTTKSGFLIYIELVGDHVPHRQNQV